MGDTAVRGDPVVANLAEALEFKSIFTSSLQSLIDLFEVNNYELRIAGGAVRWVKYIIPDIVFRAGGGEGGGFGVLAW